MAEDKYNRKNPAVKRILQEVKEMQSNPSDDFMSLPLEVFCSPSQALLKDYGFLVHIFLICFVRVPCSQRFVLNLDSCCGDKKKILGKISIAK